MEPQRDEGTVPEEAAPAARTSGPGVDGASGPGEDESDLSPTGFLIREYVAGNKERFAALFDRHQQAVRCSIARRLGCKLRDLTDVDDVLQETFLAAWRYLDEGRFEDLRTIGGFRNLLVKIAVQKIKDAAKKKGRARSDRGRNVPLDEVESVLGSGEARPSEIARSREFEEAMERALVLLPERDRWLLDCHEHLGMSTEEIAQELGCIANTVRVRLHRARERYREKLREIAPPDRRTD